MSEELKEYVDLRDEIDRKERKLKRKKRKRNKLREELEGEAYEEFESCLWDSEEEEEVVDCAHDFRRSTTRAPFHVPGGARSYDEKARDIVKEHAVNRMDWEELKELWEKSAEEEVEFGASICSDGSIKDVKEGESEQVRQMRDKDSDCKVRVGTVHTHPSKCATPSGADKKRIWKGLGVSCVVSKYNSYCFEGADDGIKEVAHFPICREGYSPEGWKPYD